jgi:hypothetical protein
MTEQNCVTCQKKLGFIKFKERGTEGPYYCADCWKVSKIEEKIEDGDKAILASDKMSEEDLRTEIYKDTLNLKMHETGTRWMRVGTLLSGSSTDQMLGAGFKMLVDQNKILIRQNELILRALRALSSSTAGA